MELFMYGTATNTGKGFFTHQDRQHFYLAGHPGNVWVIGKNEKGALWLAAKDEDKAMSSRPGPITLPYA
jgi:hypothetical protein